MTHTPTPWEYIERQDGTCEVYEDSGELIMSDAGFYPVAPSLEDMKHIVKCVNMHDGLVEALIDTLKECDRSRRPSYALQLRIRATLKKAGAL